MVMVCRGGRGGDGRIAQWIAFSLHTKRPRVRISAEIFSLYCLVCGQYWDRTHLMLKADAVQQRSKPSTTNKKNGMPWKRKERKTEKPTERLEEISCLLLRRWVTWRDVTKTHCSSFQHDISSSRASELISAHWNVLVPEQPFCSLLRPGPVMMPPSRLQWTA